MLQDTNLEVALSVEGGAIAGFERFRQTRNSAVHVPPRRLLCHRRSLIDGRDVRDLTIASLRAQIAIVTQDTILFNDTVRNNIAYWQPGDFRRDGGGSGPGGAGPRLSWLCPRVMTR